MVIYRWLADTVVVLHAAYVAFVIAGLLAVLMGVLLRWRWVRNFSFRAVHFLMIAVVVVESLLGITCPLTTWEDTLRLKAGEEVTQGTFIGRWAHEVLFYDAPPWVFTIAYCVFGGLVLLALVLVPPERPRCRTHTQQQ
jgi:hypothetical protein